MGLFDDATGGEEPEPTPGELARGRRTFRRLDILVAALFVALGLVVFYEVATKLALLYLGQVGPGMLPFGVACILVAMGALIIVQNLRGVAATSGGHMPNAREGGRVAAVVGLIVAAAALIPYLGTLTALALFIVGELRFVEGRSWPVSVATALLVPFFVFVAFEALLGVRLPAGVLGLL